MGNQPPHLDSVSESVALNFAPFYIALDVQLHAIDHFKQLGIECQPRLNKVDELLEVLLSLPVLIVTGILGIESLEEGPFAELAQHIDEHKHVELGATCLQFGQAG